MQRAKRRLASRASVNTPTTSSSRMRARSRTASAAGDCTTINRSSNNFVGTSEGKNKLRSNRKNTRLNSLKFKKNSKINKYQRPTYGSLQNAVVLAPFYTLKKCFQTKLVDLYAKEKAKNHNKKIKKAKKQNLSFEYDVFELKSRNARKNGKPSVSQKRKLAQVRAKKTKNSSSRSLSYCQCDKKNSNEHENVSQKKIVQEAKVEKQLLKKNEIQSFESPSFLYSSLVHSFDNQGLKKNKNNNPITMVMSFQNDFERQNFNFPKSNDNIPEATSSSASIFSSRMDSWETYSDSFSCKEEQLQGSLALSTTSFDSILEQSDKNKMYPSNDKDPKYVMQLKALDEGKEDETNRFHPSKPHLGNLIASSETKNSDDGIVDFMDREPLSRKISNVDIPQNLHPLRRQSRNKEKKRDSENGSCRNYYLRSLNSNKRNLRKFQVSEDESLILSSIKNYPRTSNSSNPCNSFELTTPSNSLHEATQLFAITECRLDDGNVSFRADEKLLKITELEPNHIQVCYEPATSTSKTLESYSQTEEVTHNSKPNPKTLLVKKKSSIAPLNINNTANNEREPNCEILHQRKTSISPTHQEDAQVKESNKQEKASDHKTKTEKKNNEDVSKSTILLPSVGDGNNTIEPAGHISNVEQLSYESHESSGRPFDKLVSQLEHEDSYFIFGPGNLSSRLGESCKFSFGLNCMLSSDEENSNHGEFFFKFNKFL